jgi:hypothetical protein
VHGAERKRRRWGEIDTSSITGVDERAADRFTDRPVDSDSDFTDLERGRNHHKRAGRRPTTSVTHVLITRCAALLEERRTETDRGTDVHPLR